MFDEMTVIDDNFIIIIIEKQRKNTNQIIIWIIEKTLGKEASSRNFIHKETLFEWPQISIWNNSKTTYPIWIKFLYM